MYIHLYHVLMLLAMTALMFYLLPSQQKWFQILVILVWLAGTFMMIHTVIKNADSSMQESADVVV